MFSFASICYSELDDAQKENERIIYILSCYIPYFSIRHNTRRVSLLYNCRGYCFDYSCFDVYKNKQANRLPSIRDFQDVSVFSLGEND